MQNKVLIVEDSTDSREFLKVWLEIPHYEVTEARIGEEAINSVMNDHQDLILMDIAMPVMNWITTSKIIRKLEGLIKIPIMPLPVTVTYSTVMPSAQDLMI